MSSNLTPDNETSQSELPSNGNVLSKEPIWKKVMRKFSKGQQAKAVSQIDTQKPQTSDSHEALRNIAALPEEPELKPIYPKPDESQLVSHMDISPTAKPQGNEQNPNKSQFLQNQQEFLKKHADEVRPLETGPFSVGIVERVYRELSNGNFTESLISLVSQTIPVNEFRAYYAVNNVRLIAIASEIYDAHAEEVKGLSDRDKNSILLAYVRDAYRDKNITMTPEEIGSIDMYSAPLEKRIQDYRENQATLGILQSLTLAVNALSREPSNLHDQIISGTMEKIEQLASGYMTDAQVETLLNASHAIIRKRISVMGIDCSSFNKSYEKTNHGQATNEAAHIALAQGAKMIDVSDMDEFHGPDALREVVDVAQKGRIDVLMRPLTVIAPQHPEQLDPDSPALWPDLVSYYINSLTSRTRHYATSHNRSSGTQIVSAKAFRRHEYPHKGYNEDFKFASDMREDHALVKRFAISTDLRLANRGRDVSWDGAGVGSRSHYKDVESLRTDVEPKQRENIRQLVLKDRWLVSIIGKLQQVYPGTPDLVAAYEQQREQFFKEIQAERARLRHTFLGIRANGLVDQRGILPLVYNVWQSHPDWTPDQIIGAINLRPRKRAFFDQNPLLIKAALQELQRIQNSMDNTNIENSPSNNESSTNFISLSSAIQHIVDSLPELVGEPLIQEPSYDIADIANIPPGEVNETNWTHLTKSQLWLANYISNLGEEGAFSSKVRGELAAIMQGI